MTTIVQKSAIRRTQEFTNTTKNKSLAGFTIVELMIATSVFSVILLLITFGLIQVGRTYYKGITLTKTQNAARTIMDIISQDIQFSGGSINVPVSYPLPYPDLHASDLYAICIGEHRYSVKLDKQIPKETPQALNVDKYSSCNTALPLNLIPGSGESCNLPDCRELLDANMRIAKFSVVPDATNTGLYNINLTVIYGDTDLLEDNHQSCKLQTGAEFCAAVSISTTVQKRIISTAE